MVKLLGISGSPRKAATEYILDEALDAASQVDGVQCEKFSLRGKKLNFCVNCDRCVREGADFCTAYDDDMRDIYKAFYEADGYIIASPVYEMGITGQLATFFNRFRPTYTILKNDPFFFSKKVGCAVAVGGTRNGGQESTIAGIHGFYHTHGILVVNGGLGVYAGASVWSRDRRADGAKEDETGMANVRGVARKTAETALLIKKGMGAV